MTPNPALQTEPKREDEPPSTSWLDSMVARTKGYDEGYRFNKAWDFLKDILRSYMSGIDRDITDNKLFPGLSQTDFIDGKMDNIETDYNKILDTTTWASQLHEWRTQVHWRRSQLEELKKRAEDSIKLSISGEYKIDKPEEYEDSYLLIHVDIADVTEGAIRGAGCITSDMDGLEGKTLHCSPNFIQGTGYHVFKMFHEGNGNHYADKSGKYQMERVAGLDGVTLDEANEFLAGQMMPLVVVEGHEGMPLLETVLPVVMNKYVKQLEQYRERTRTKLFEK